MCDLLRSFNRGEGAVAVGKRRGSDGGTRGSRKGGGVERSCSAMKLVLSGNSLVSCVSCVLFITSSGTTQTAWTDQRRTNTVYNDARCHTCTLRRIAA